MAKKVVGIVTIDDYTNYGNRLQNYALTKLLEDYFVVLNGVRVSTKEDWINITSDVLKRTIKRYIPFTIVKKKLSFVEPFKGELLKKRKQKFIKFTLSYTVILEAIVKKNHRQVQKQMKNYCIDYYITGSDQVWNPYYEGKEYEFLTFAPKDKRLSFAASMGVEDIPNIDKKRYKKNLSDMKYISVREKRAAEIVKELTGREADLTLDPTLLLEKEEWDKIARKPEILLEEKYMCTYFLGEVPRAVRLFAEKTGLKIYALNSKENLELYTIDPAEFLYMIKNAEYVLTDSFHAVAFSMKFNKEFYVFKREQAGVSNMFSRIETITQRFGLENRIQSRNEIVEQNVIDNWSEIEEELVKEKKKSMKKLLEVMEN